MHDKLKIIYESIMVGNQENTQNGVQEALAAGIPPDQILNEGMISAMAEIGRLFEEGEYFVPEMLISARAMQGGLGILKPALLQADVKAIGKVVIGTVKGDLHDIGKNLVIMMLEGAGFEVFDLGVDVGAEKFISSIQEYGADIVAMSALLTTTMTTMGEIIKKLESEGVRQKIKIMVGGAPLNDDFAQNIGADGYSKDASRAVTLAKSLMGVA